MKATHEIRVLQLFTDNSVIDMNILKKCCRNVAWRYIGRTVFGICIYYTYTYVNTILTTIKQYYCIYVCRISFVFVIMFTVNIICDYGKHL